MSPAPSAGGFYSDLLLVPLKQHQVGKMPMLLALVLLLLCKMRFIYNLCT